ncbi:hypothetical protein [Nocardia cyriacigeorgica]|uniref:hypothetical protein n=1 Tax=Nocardia cyriacigeorgica TaxID=135487 RepID=UPI0013D4F0D0|nr:hypothetical protein [Nocardia cyriacigeorgica]NEW29474.1 hypothetical protein [Nocardia cyriacigeorgica]
MTNSDDDLLTQLDALIDSKLETRDELADIKTEFRSITSEIQAIGSQLDANHEEVMQAIGNISARLGDSQQGLTSHPWGVGDRFTEINSKLDAMTETVKVIHNRLPK